MNVPRLRPSGISEIVISSREEEEPTKEYQVHYVKNNLAKFNSCGLPGDRECKPPERKVHSAPQSPRQRRMSSGGGYLEVHLRDLEATGTKAKSRLTYIKYNQDAEESGSPTSLSPKALKETLSLSLIKSKQRRPAGPKRSTALGGLVIPPVSGKHRFTIIFLHGLGDRPHTWAPYLTNMSIEDAKLILPKARKRCIKACMFLRLNAWFNINRVGEGAKVDVKGLQKSIRRIESIIESEIRLGVPPERIFLGGFSQGGALALTIAQQSKHRFAGVVSLSGWLPMPEDTKACPEKEYMPVLFCHGDKDPLVAHRRALKSARCLDRVGMDVKVHIFQGLDHDLHDAELETIKEFIEHHVRLTMESPQGSAVLNR